MAPGRRPSLVGWSVLELGDATAPPPGRLPAQRTSSARTSRVYATGEVCQDCPIKYLALIYGNREIWDVGPERRREIIAAVDAFNRRLADSGELVAVDGLVPRPRAVRAHDGVPVVSDGPYLEAKEHVGSYFIVDVGSEERALEIAQSYPALGPEGGGIELWPLMSGSGGA